MREGEDDGHQSAGHSRYDLDDYLCIQHAAHAAESVQDQGPEIVQSGQYPVGQHGQHYSLSLCVPSACRPHLAAALVLPVLHCADAGLVSALSMASTRAGLLLTARLSWRQDSRRAEVRWFGETKDAYGR